MSLSFFLGVETSESSLTGSQRSARSGASGGGSGRLSRHGVLERVKDAETVVAEHKAAEFVLNRYLSFEILKREGEMCFPLFLSPPPPPPPLPPVFPLPSPSLSLVFLPLSPLLPSPLRRGARPLFPLFPF